MLRNVFWLAVAAAALAAIGGGFASGVMAAKPPRLVQLRDDARTMPTPRDAFVRDDAPGAAEIEADAFAQDDVVADRIRPADADRWQPERLALVVGLCGYSAVLDAQFLELREPLAFIVDPRAPQAAQVAAIARGARAMLLVQIAQPPGTRQLSNLRGRIGAFGGVAARDAAGMARALRDTGLIFFDERGNAPDAPFRRAGVALVHRDVTADDVGEAGYVTFMLGRAAALSRRAGTMVVLVRPMPSTLAALRALRSRRDVALVALR